MPREKAQPPGNLALAKLIHRTRRYKRFHELDAPQSIMERERELIFEALGEFDEATDHQHPEESIRATD